MTSIKAITLTLMAIGISMPALADDCQMLDQQLAIALASAEQSSNYGDAPNEDKLETSNQQIATVLQNFGTNKETIECPFTLAQQQHLEILTSRDSRFRAFSWDDNSGGTMRFFNQYVQFTDDDGYSHIEHIDSDGFITSLFTTTVQGKPLYLLTTTSIGSSKIAVQVLNLYQIQADKLIKPKLIKTKEGLTNNLGFGYDFFSVVDRPERPIKLFEFDEKSQTIRFPVVIEDKNFMDGKVTNRFIQYQFDGQYFVKK